MPRSCVVVGGGVAGLTAAIHARLGGADVLLLEQHATVGGKAAGIEVEGYRLDPGPSIIILTQHYADIFRQASRRMEDYLRFRRLDPFTRVYFEHQPPLDLSADREDCLDALGSDFPEDRANLRRLLETLDAVRAPIERTIFARPFEKPWQLAHPDLIKVGIRFDVRKTYRELVDGWFKSPLLRSFFYGFPSYGGQTYDSKAAGALMIPYLMLADGVWYPEGGVAAIPCALATLATELGVEIRTNCRVDRVEYQGDRMQAVYGADERFEAESWVVNVDPATFGQFLGRTESREPSFSYFTIHWGQARSSEKLEHHTLVVPPGWESGFEDLYRRHAFPEHPIVYLNVTNRIDPATAPSDKDNLFAVVTSPAKRSPLDWEQETPLYRERVAKTLAPLGLGFEGANFERIQNPLYFERAHGNYAGSLYGLDEKYRLFGVFPPTNRDPHLRNLFYCGGAVQPGAGLPMAVLSGRFAADLALRN